MGCTLSVSIVTYGINESLFESVLKHLQTAIDEAVRVGLLGSSQLTIVDNGNDRELLNQLVRQISSGCITAEIISNPKNSGYGAAHNTSINRSAANYHLILNPDALLAPGALIEGFGYLNNNTEVTLVSPLAVTSTGKPAYLCKRYPSVLDLLLRGFLPGFLKKLARQRLARYEYQDLDCSLPTKGITIASGCCMLCRTSALRAINGFNKDFFLYFEDFDLSLRIAREGPIAYLPAMRIVHHGGEAASKGLAHVLLFCRSGITFFRKHGWKWW